MGDAPGEPDGRRDVDADWGVKTYQGEREDGNLWQKLKSWFGYKLHLLVDANRMEKGLQKAHSRWAGQQPA